MKTQIGAFGANIPAYCIDARNTAVHTCVRRNSMRSGSRVVRPSSFPPMLSTVPGRCCTISWWLNARLCCTNDSAHERCAGFCPGRSLNEPSLGFDFLRTRNAPPCHVAIKKITKTKYQHRRHRFEALEMPCSFDSTQLRGPKLQVEVSILSTYTSLLGISLNQNNPHQQRKAKIAKKSQVQDDVFKHMGERLC